MPEIRSTQIETLRAFLRWPNGEGDTSDVARRFSISVPAARNRLNRLADRKLLRRHHEEDRYGPYWLYTLTAKGRSLAEKTPDE